MIFQYFDEILKQGNEIINDDDGIIQKSFIPFIFFIHIYSLVKKALL